MKEQQQCIDHRMWDKNFLIAQWLLLGMGFFLIFFSEATWEALIFIGGSLIFWLLRARNDVRHHFWHMENDGKGV